MVNLGKFEYWLSFKSQLLTYDSDGIYEVFIDLCDRIVDIYEDL